MNSNLDPHAITPWAVLEISEQADAGQIRAAYLEKVKQFPPDRAGEQFELIRDAYAQLKDPLGIRMAALLGESPSIPLSTLLNDQPKKRRTLGPSAWLDVIKQQGKGGHTYDD